MEYRKVFPIQNQVVYANGEVPYIHQESLEDSNALLRVDFNAFRTFVDSKFSDSVLSLGLTEVPKFIVTEYHLEGPYDVHPQIQDSWRTIGKNSSVLTHLAPLDMEESDYVHIVRSQIILYSKGRSWLGLNSKGRRMIDHVSEGTYQILSLDPSKMDEVEHNSFTYDFVNEDNDAVGNLKVNFNKNLIELDVIGIDSSADSDIIMQYFQLVSGFNKNRLPSHVTMRGKFSKGFAFRPNIEGKSIDDLLKDSDILLQSDKYNGYSGERS